MKRIILLLALLVLPGCREITQAIWDGLVDDSIENQQEEPYTKEVRLTASIDNATGPEELETAMLATSGHSVVNCDDGKKYDLIGTFDEVSRIFTFQRFYIVYDDYNCELRVFFDGPWTALEQERFFYYLIEFDPVKTTEDIFIEFEEIVIE